MELLSEPPENLIEAHISMLGLAFKAFQSDELFNICFSSFHSYLLLFGRRHLLLNINFCCVCAHVFLRGPSRCSPGSSERCRYCLFRKAVPSMVSYPSDYDSSGEIQSIEFHDHEGDAPKLPHQDLNFPIPSGLTVTWKNGRRDRVGNLEILATGASFIVLRGIDVSSSTLSPYVFKLQGWTWPHASNGYEHWIVSEYMNKFAPHFLGSVKVQYTAHKKTGWERTHTVSVSVVRKIDRRVKDFIDGLAQNYVAEDTVDVMMSVMKSFFDTVYQLCVSVNLTLTDLGTTNVGVESSNGQNFVVVLDAETAKPMPQTDDKWQRLTKAKATKAVTTFFSDFEIQTRAASSEERWQILCSTIHAELYTSWFKQLQAIPTPGEIEAKILQCCEKVTMALRDVRSTAMPPPAPRDRRRHSQSPREFLRALHMWSRPPRACLWGIYRRKVPHRLGLQSQQSCLHLRRCQRFERMRQVQHLRSSFQCSTFLRSFQ